MRERVELLLGRRTRAMWVMTFHSACARMLRSEAPRLGYSKSFTIYDQADSRRQIKRVLDDLGVDPKRYTPAAIGAQISDAKNKLRDGDAYRQMVARSSSRPWPTSTTSTSARCTAPTRWTSTTCSCARSTCSSCSRRSASATRPRSATCSSTSTRTPTTRSTAGCSCWPGEHRNLAVVGDDDQCLAAGTRVTMADGTQRPIEEVQVGDEVLSCYGSGDFRAARVARTHRAHAPELVRIATRGGRVVISTPEHTHFAGYRLGLTPQLHLTYAMWRRAVGFRVGTSRVYTEGQRKPVVGAALRTRQRARGRHLGGLHPPQRGRGPRRGGAALAALPGADASLRRPPARRRPRLGRRPGPDRRRVRAASAPYGGGERLLEDEGLSRDHPHFVPASHDGRRRNLVVTLCGDRRGARRCIGSRSPARPRGSRGLGGGRHLGARCQARLARLAIRVLLQGLRRPSRRRRAHPVGRRRRRAPRGAVGREAGGHGREPAVHPCLRGPAWHGRVHRRRRLRRRRDRGAHSARRRRLRPQYRAHPQLRRQRARHPQQHLCASAAPTSATSSISRTRSKTRRRSGSSRTTAPPRPSSASPTPSSRTTADAWPSRCGPTSARAIRSRSARCPTSTPRRATSPARSSGSSTRASRARRSRSSTAPTRSRACSRTRWCGPRSATRSSAARSSTSGPRSRTPSPT